MRVPAGGLWGWIRTAQVLVTGNSCCLVTLSLLPAMLIAPQCSSASAAMLQATSQTDVGTVAEMSVADVTGVVRKSLVQIRATARDGSDQGIGAGFVIDDKGLVVTARHVIGDGRDFVVDLPDGSSSRVTEVYASSSQLDVAIIRMETTSLPPLTLATPELVQQGRDVVALGHPRGLRDSVVSGVISGRREIDGINMIQLAMPIEPGNSGGPVVDRQGRVLGVVTLKSTSSDNLGFAIPVDDVRKLLTDPNPVPMEKWRTIGALDPRHWSVQFGANWRQHAGRILVNGMGTSFGGRTLCLQNAGPPGDVFEIRVRVKLDDERGAAGLVFHSDGGDLHYGFYPSGGGLRLTRFAGSDVNSWTILHNSPHPAYRPNEWNVLSVKVRPGLISCFVNGELVTESTDTAFTTGKVGLAAFRGTEADFRNFEVAAELPSVHPDQPTTDRLSDIISRISESRPATTEQLNELVPFADYTTDYFEKEAQRLERRAKQLRKTASDLHQTAVRKQILEEFAIESSPDRKPDLLKLSLLVAKLDNPDVDVAAYLERVDAMADEVKSTFAADAAMTERLQKLDEYLFTAQGYHGSRFEYYTRSNSYLNEVIDDREGLPITLSVLYLAMAERLGIPMSGIGLPGHFVVRYEAEKQEDSVLIDVFERGKRLTSEEAANIVLAAGAPNIPEFYAPQTTQQIIRRMLANLLGLAEQDRVDDDALRYLELLVELAPEELEYRAKRLELRARTDRLAEAIEDVNWFIDKESVETDQDRLLELRAELQRQLERQNETP